MGSIQLATVTNTTSEVNEICNEVGWSLITLLHVLIIDFVLFISGFQWKPLQNPGNQRLATARIGNFPWYPAW